MYRINCFTLWTLLLVMTFFVANDASAQRFRRFGNEANKSEVQTVTTSTQTTPVAEEPIEKDSATQEVQVAAAVTASAVTETTVAPTAEVAALKAQYQGVSTNRLESDGCVRVEHNGLQGLVDLQGQVLLPIEYDNIGHDNFIIGGRDNYLPTCKHALYGVINKCGRVIVPCVSQVPVEEEIEKRGYAPVRVNDKWGLVDTLGRYVISPRFVDPLVVGNAYGNEAFQIKVCSQPYPQTGLIQRGYLVMPIETDSLGEANPKFSSYIKLPAEEVTSEQQKDYYN